MDRKLRFKSRSLLCDLNLFQEEDGSWTVEVYEFSNNQTFVYEMNFNINLVTLIESYIPTGEDDRYHLYIESDYGGTLSISCQGVFHSLFTTIEEAKSFSENNWYIKLHNINQGA